MSERDDIIRKYGQEIAAGNCHHTNIGEMRTIYKILGDVFDAGAGHWMSGFADMAKERDDAKTARDRFCIEWRNGEAALLSRIEKALEWIKNSDLWQVKKALVPILSGTPTPPSEEG